MMQQVNPYAQYQEQNVMTASPGELTLMLYDGCVKALRRAVLFVRENNIQDAHSEFVRAQAILTELNSTLDPQYEISQSLAALYDFMIAGIASANVRKDVSEMDGIIELLVDLRDTWQKAVALSRRVTLRGAASVEMNA